MQAWKAILAVIMLTPSTSCSDARPLPSDQVTVSGETVTVRGQISKDLVEEVIKVLRETPSVRSLRITSTGGDARYGIHLGRAVKARNLNVIAAGMCASACAQYVLLAGHRKIVLPGTIIALHSGPSAMEMVLSKSPMHAQASVFQRVAGEERQFYRMLGVDEELGLVSASFMQPLCVFRVGPAGSSNPWHYGVGWNFSAFIPSVQQLEQLGVSSLEGSWPSENGLAADLVAAGLNARFRPVFRPQARLSRDLIPVGVC